VNYYVEKYELLITNNEKYKINEPESIERNVKDAFFAGITSMVSEGEHKQFYKFFENSLQSSFFLESKVQRSGLRNPSFEALKRVAPVQELTSLLIPMKSI